MAVASEILRFILPRSSGSGRAFAELRGRVAARGLATTQYFGYVMPNEGMPRPKPANQMCWYIEWPEKSPYRASHEFRAELAQIASDTPRSLLFELTETKTGEILKGLESNACQFAIIHASPDAPRLDPGFELSMHKTFTDTYLAPGFTGGGWGYALNSNNADGDTVTSREEPRVEEKERRLAYYILGWETIEDHHVYAKTDLFEEEINKLAPYFAPGTGAFYVKFEKHA